MPISITLSMSYDDVPRDEVGINVHATDSMETTTGHVIGPTGHYDVIDFAFVAPLGNKRKIDVVIMTSSRAAWQQTQNR